MADATSYIAVDLGAESGRVMVGMLDGGQVELVQVHRFANTPVHLPDGLHWNVHGLYQEILVGMRAAARAYGETIIGVGIDAWAVDYGLVDAGGRLLGTPHHYRDTRTDGVSEEVARHVSRAEQYARTGIAQLPFNTLYQLAAQKRVNDQTLNLAGALLLIPDLLHYWLTGEQVTEYTNASTTGMLAVDGRFASDLITRLELPSHLLLQPTPAGTSLGVLRSVVREETGLVSGQVILPATHDTASAIVAVPTAANQPCAYISSGTWSLLGLELDHPVLCEEARLAGFTNEGGAAGTFCFLTNIMGLWLLQECRRCWKRRGEVWTYEELIAWAAAMPPSELLIDVADSAFLHPDDMVATIAQYLRRTGQTPVTEPGLLGRAILESLALAYRVKLREAEWLSGTRVRTIHVVGGGARNALLCQLTADACRRPVVAGPAEASALGNILVQAMGTGQIRDLNDAHLMARASSDLVAYEPREGIEWEDRVSRLRDICVSQNA